MIPEEPTKEVEEVITKENENFHQLFSIVIKEADAAITEDDDLFSRHSNLKVIKQNGKYHYLIGEYDSELGVNKFYKTVKIAYPDSYPVSVYGETFSKL